MAEAGTYRTIAESLRHRINTGELPVGAMLPSEAALASLHSVARGTVRAALGVLTDEGLIEVVPGQGRRVAGTPPVDLAPATLYERIAMDLRGRIDLGEFGDSDALPSESMLMTQYQTSRNTVRRAYRHLAEQGVVVIRHGSGAFPAPR